MEEKKQRVMASGGANHDKTKPSGSLRVKKLEFDPHVVSVEEIQASLQPRQTKHNNNNRRKQQEDKANSSTSSSDSPLGIAYRRRSVRSTAATSSSKAVQLMAATRARRKTRGAAPCKRTHGPSARTAATSTATAR